MFLLVRGIHRVQHRVEWLRDVLARTLPENRKEITVQEGEGRRILVETLGVDIVSQIV